MDGGSPSAVSLALVATECSLIEILEIMLIDLGCTSAHTKDLVQSVYDRGLEEILENKEMKVVLK